MSKALEIIMKCPKCNTDGIKERSVFAFAIGAIECSYCGVAIEPAKVHLILLALVAPIITVILMLLVLGGLSLVYYLALSSIFCIVFMTSLYFCPVRAIEERKVLGQRPAFGPTRGPLTGLILVYGFGALFWVV